MEEITVSADMLIGLLIGIFVPTFIWALKMFSMTKQLRDMHLDPDTHGFGSGEIKDLLIENLEAQGHTDRECSESNKALRYAIKELTHFMKWAVEESSGRKPPPYVGGTDD